jgi:hypothetical protein
MRAPAEPVSHPSDGLDDVIAEFAAQVAHVDLDDVAAGVVVVAPDAAEDLLAGEHLSGVRDEHLQQGELAGGELDGATGAAGGAGPNVDGNVARAQGRRRGPVLGARRPLPQS